MNAPPVLAVEGLGVALPAGNEWIGLVREVSFRIDAGRTLALVGESGAGKSLTAMAIAGLARLQHARVSGSIRLRGHELQGLGESSLRGIRGKDIGVVFQDPRQSFNPAFTVGEQVAEVLRRHARIGRQAARIRVIDLFKLVGIRDAARRYDDYPHTFSGGMLQRAMIAMAIACEPALLIADEPTTALDVTVQAQILGLLKRLQSSLGMAMLYVSHDMGTVAEVSDDVVVMYSGEVIEAAPTQALFGNPRHPYTAGILGSVTRLGPQSGTLRAIPGRIPTAGRPPAGCGFHPRCTYATADCAAAKPRLVQDAGRSVRCLHADTLSLEGIA